MPIRLWRSIWESGFPDIFQKKEGRQQYGKTIFCPAGTLGRTGGRGEKKKAAAILLPDGYGMNIELRAALFRETPKRAPEGRDL